MSSGRKTGAPRAHADRAAQFMPFAALTGFYDMVREAERVEEPRHDLSDEDVERISGELAAVRKGDVVRVTHYEDGAYVTREGVLTRLDVAERELRVVQARIRFEDVWEIGPVRARP